MRVFSDVYSQQDRNAVVPFLDIPRRLNQRVHGLRSRTGSVKASFPFTLLCPFSSIHPPNFDEKTWKQEVYSVGRLKKTRCWGNQLLFHFLNLYVEKKTLAKAVTCTMIFYTASTMKNLSLNSQNRLFSCSGIGLFIGFLVFHLIKISFVKPEACAIIFSTASPVFKFMK